MFTRAFSVPLGVVLVGALFLGGALAAPGAVAQDDGCDLDCQGVVAANDVPLSDVIADPGFDDVVRQSDIDVAMVIDRDGDGLSDAEEALYAADPTNPDTDGDSLSDGDEIDVYGTFPFSADTEGDGVSDADELFVYGTSPRTADTDGDTFGDGDELFRYATDPLDAASYPDAPVNGRW